MQCHPGLGWAACPPPRVSLSVGTQARTLRLLGRPGEKAGNSIRPSPGGGGAESLGVSPEPSGASWVSDLPNTLTKTTCALSGGRCRLALPVCKVMGLLSPAPMPWDPGLAFAHSGCSTWHLSGASREKPASPRVRSASRGQEPGALSHLTPPCPPWEAWAPGTQKLDRAAGAHGTAGHGRGKGARHHRRRRCHFRLAAPD